jgi:hypothetical protein
MTIEQKIALVAEHAAWVDTIRDPKTGWASYHPSDAPAHLQCVDNIMRSEAGIHHFLTDKPTRYFGYVHETPMHGIAQISNSMRVTLSAGKVHASPVYRSNFGDRRCHITFKAINGLWYFGCYAGMDHQSCFTFKQIKDPK